MYENMSKYQLREACKAAGIRNASKMTNDGMRTALLAQSMRIDVADVIDTSAEDGPEGTVIVENTPDLQRRTAHQSRIDGIVNQCVEITRTAIAAGVGLPSVVDEIEGCIPPVVTAEFQRTRDWQRVENNTPSRNRKGRKVRFRTLGRARRWFARHAQQHLDLTTASK